MNIRKPVFTSDSRIDCEIEHPDHGWIPFTADPNDVEKFGRSVYAAALKMRPASYVAPLVSAPTKAQQETNRRAAYIVESDPLFFMAQRGESTTEEWAAKVNEIKARFPYPVE